MNCAKCGAPTSVIDSRLTSDNFMRRRRQCDGCGERVTTWESTRKPSAALWARKNGTAAVARWRTANPEKAERLRLRDGARREAARTGEDVGAIYRRWGCE